MGIGSLSSPSVSANINYISYPPTLVTNQITISSGQTVILTSTDLSATDVAASADELVFTASGISHGQFEYLNNPGTAINLFSQSKIQTADISFVHDGSTHAPSYNISVSDGILSTNPKPAIVNFNPGMTPNSIETSNSIRNTIIGSVVSGIIGLGFLAVRYGINYYVNKRMKQAFEKGETQIEKERAEFFKDVIEPTAKKIFDAIKTTSLMGYRSESDTKAYIAAIERLITRLEELGVELDMRKLSPQRQTRLFNEIVRQTKRVLVPKRSFCSTAYVCSFFKSDVNPLQFDTKVDEIAQAVFENLSSQILVNLPSSSRTRETDVELIEVKKTMKSDDQSAQLEQRVRSIEKGMRKQDKRMEKIEIAMQKLLTREDLNSESGESIEPSV